MRALLPFTCAFFLVAACGGSSHDRSSGGTDAGGSRDAGTDGGGGGGDAGCDACSGPGCCGFDAGGPTDAGEPMDAMMALDAGRDAHVDWPDDAGMAPDWVDLTVGPVMSCPPFMACGGDVVGTWDVAGGCVEVDIEMGIMRCPGAMVTSRTGRARGRVIFGSDGIARRVADSEVEIAIFIPALCAMFVSCETIESMLAMSVTEASCTTEATGDCNCTGRQITHIDNTDAYTIEGNEIVGTTRRWEYCIAGDSLSYRDSTPGMGMREPGVIELARAP
jgi:hypothetical protein